jgi:hypothetical protein
MFANLYGATCPLSRLGHRLSNEVAERIRASRAAHLASMGSYRRAATVSPFGHAHAPR